MLTALPFLSTPPAWGATHQIVAGILLPHISIHAPRMGSDGLRPGILQREVEFLSTPPAWGATHQIVAGILLPHISIHAPRMGSDGLRPGILQREVEFLSTPPAWGATRPLLWTEHSPQDFYPRPPHGERRTQHGFSCLCNGISIHAPRMGSDDFRNIQEVIPRIFLSTPPAWGATRAGQRRGQPPNISIHAPRMGSDGSPLSLL